MIEELKKLFNKKFSYQTTICTSCKIKTNHVMIDGENNVITHIICDKCKNKSQMK